MADEVKPYTTLGEIDDKKAKLLKSIDVLRAGDFTRTSESSLLSGIVLKVEQLAATARAGLADSALDWYDKNPHALVYSSAYHGRMGGWTVVATNEEYPTLRAAIDAARGVHPGGATPETAGASAGAEPRAIPADAALLLDALKIAAAKVVYRVGEWRPDLQRQALGEEAVVTDCGEALAELVRIAGVHRGPDGYPQVQLRGAELERVTPATRPQDVPSGVPTPAPTEDECTDCGKHLGGDEGDGATICTECIEGRRGNETGNTPAPTEPPTLCATCMRDDHPGNYVLPESRTRADCLKCGRKRYLYSVTDATDGSPTPACEHEPTVGPDGIRTCSICGVPTSAPTGEASQ